MKTLLLLLVVLIAAACKYNKKRHKELTKTYSDVILRNDNLWHLIISTDAAEEPCVQGHSYEIDCNTCTCQENKIYVCTQRACYNGPQFADTPVDSQHQPVAPHNHHRRDVNVSTGKYDLPVTKAPNYLRFDVDRCEPNEVKNQVRKLSSTKT